MEVFRGLIGSQNYGLDGPDSDRDYYIYHTPSFEDLYLNRSLVREEKHADGIYFHKDIRSLVGLIKKASFNQLEILWSEEVESNETKEYTFSWLYEDLKRHRNKITIANLPRLYQSTLGEIKRRISDIERNKYTEGTKHLFEKYGYDTKNAMHAFRLGRLLKNMKSAQILDFKHSDVQLPYGRSLLHIKEGWIRRSEILEHLEKEHLSIIELAPWFDSHSMNIDLLAELENKIYNVVKGAVKLKL